MKNVLIITALIVTTSSSNVSAQFSQDINKEILDYFVEPCVKKMLNQSISENDILYDLQYKLMLNYLYSSSYFKKQLLRTTMAASNLSRSERMEKYNELLKECES